MNTTPTVTSGFLFRHEKRRRRQSNSQQNLKIQSNWLVNWRFLGGDITASFRRRARSKGNGVEKRQSARISANGEKILPSSNYLCIEANMNMWGVMNGCNEKDLWAKTTPRNVPATFVQNNFNSFFHNTKKPDFIQPTVQ